MTPAASHMDRSGERGDSGSVELATLDLLQRLLLVTDGTVTQLLAVSMNEQIEAALLGQRVRVAEGEPRALELSEEQRILERHVLLRGAVSGRNYLHGASVVVLDRLPQAVGAALVDGDAPIGLLLRQHRVETFREILWFRAAVAGDLAPYFLVAEEAPMLARRYRIWVGQRPAMLITETFPRSHRPHRGPPSTTRPAHAADRRRRRWRRCES